MKPVKVNGSRRARPHRRALPRRRRGETPEHFAHRLTSRQIMDILHQERADRMIPVDLPDREYRNEYGRVVFDDPEVERINRFHEENGPRGVGFPNGEADVEEVREITANPNYGKPRSEWR